MNCRMRSASSVPNGYSERTKLSVRTTAGTPLWVFQSASRWNSAARLSAVMIT